MNLYKVLLTHNSNKKWFMKDDAVMLNPLEAKYREKNGLLEKIEIAPCVVIINEVDFK